MTEPRLDHMTFSNLEEMRRVERDFESRRYRITYNDYAANYRDVILVLDEHRVLLSWKR